MSIKGQERTANICAILLLVLIMFVCVGGALWFRQDVRVEDVCRELVGSFEYHVIDGKAYCVDYEAIELVDSGLVFKGW